MHLRGRACLSHRSRRGAQGEVLAGLQQKLKYAERERTFCCLVAESAAQPGALAGVVEVSLQGEPVRALVLAPLSGTSRQSWCCACWQVAL